MKKTLDTLRSLMHYPSIIHQLTYSKSNFFFFFPSWQIGGAERVHIDILTLLKEQSPTCFICEPQRKDGLKKEFNEVSVVIELKRWGEKKSFKPIILKKIAKVINQQKHPVIFGSNNLFFYDLIPLLNPHVKIIDLTHSFSTDKDGYEHYSLPSAPRIDKRVVLGANALNTFQSIYKNNGLPHSLIQRFNIIPNQVDAPDTLAIKAPQNALEIIFVSRNSKEKRPDLFFQIVDACFEENLEIHFTVIGDFEKDFSKYTDKVSFKGELTDKEQLKTHYRSAHLILITSTFEGFPMVLLESMANGVVPISTNVGEIPRFITEEKQTGFLIDNALPDPLKVQQFLTTISQLVLQREIIQRFAENAHRLVKHDFSKERFKKAYLEILNTP